MLNALAILREKKLKISLWMISDRLFAGEIF